MNTFDISNKNNIFKKPLRVANKPFQKYR